MATRRESVTLSLVDAGFSTGMAKAAASAALLNSQLNRLDGQTVDLDRNTVRLSESAIQGSSAIDRYSGRMGILVKTAAALGPALIPIGAVGIPAVTGLAGQFGFAAIAAGTAVAAFQGVGDALTAVNEASLEPTVENLEKAHEALERLSPAGQALVGQLSEMRPILTELRDSAATAFFPGLIDGLETLERLAPSLDAILTTVGSTLGDLFAEGAESLTSNRWADFFAVLAMNARPVLTDMAHALGDVVHGLSELWEAFMPLNRDFGSWLADAASGFDQWAQGLSQTEGFREFVAYIQENGPKVADATVAIANAVLQIVEAAAPLGGPVLEGVTSVANALAIIADSPIGTPLFAAAGAMSAISLAASAATASVTRLNGAMATLGVTSSKTGAAGIAGKGGIAGAFAVLGTIAGVNLVDNFTKAVSGERSLTEATDAVLTWSNPVGAAMETLGLDFFGASEEGNTLYGTILDVAHAMNPLQGNMAATRAESRRFGRTFFDTNIQLLKNARASERLEEKIKASNAAIRDSTAAWGDYSQKVQLGDTSLENVINRMDKLADAARNQAGNITKALERGVDPKAIRNIFNTLGPQGAVQVFDQLADASKETVREVNKTFGSLRDGKREVEQALRGVDEAITGSREKLRGLNDVKVKPKAELDTKGLQGGVVSSEQLLTGLHRERPKPKADVDISGVQSGVASAENLLTGFANRPPVHTYIYTHHVTLREGNDTAGGAPALGPGAADGGTVPRTGLPYADRHPYLLADGEEVISNRFGQADRHRELLKAINANRLADGGTAGVPVRMRGMGGGNTSTVHHTFEVVVRGEMDLTKAKAQLGQAMRDEIEQDREFARSQGN